MAGTRLSIAGVVVVIIGTAVFAQRGNPPSIAGVWRLSEITRSGPNARTITAPQPGLVIFTQRHYSISQVSGDKPRSELPPRNLVTDKQRADAYEPFTGQAGTYEIKGSEMTVRPLAAMNPNLMRPGSFTTVEFVQQGNTLAITFKADESGPIANPTTMRYTRVE